MHKAFRDRANRKQKKKKKREKWDLHISPGRYWFSVVSDYCARHRTINVLAPSRNVLTRFQSYCLHRSALLISLPPSPLSFSVHFVYVSFRTDIYIDKDWKPTGLFRSYIQFVRALFPANVDLRLHRFRAEFIWISFKIWNFDLKYDRVLCMYARVKKIFSNIFFFNRVIKIAAVLVKKTFYDCLALMLN